METQERINKYLEKTKGFTAEKIIQFAYSEFGEKLTFASSLGEEDQVITDIIANGQKEIKIFTLDTGRLFQETYELLEKTQKRYPMEFNVYYPDTQELENMVKNDGINLFYESVENRKKCCGVRKVQPLKRALKDNDAWICGLRRAQSITRTDVKSFEWDEGNQKIKINPLIDWSMEELRTYIDKHRIDVNPLHKKGFVSIGCASCTRAIKKGEDIRAGRWWWEEPAQKECGLHSGKKKG